MTDKEIIRALRLCLDEEGDCRTCNLLNDDQCVEHSVRAAVDLIERLSAENESLRKELAWKDMVIALAQKKQAEAESESDKRWISVDDELPECGVVLAF